MATHDLHHRTTLMGLHGITELIDTLQSGIAGSIIADGIGRAGDVIVNRAGNPNDRDSLLGQGQQAPKGTVAPDAY